MTAPRNTNTVTLPAGQRQAMKLMDVYGGQPVVVYNLSAEEVHIGSDMNVSDPVVLRPYAQVQWTAPGALYARVPGAVEALITVSSEVQDISTSPVDIAVQTSLELFERGVTTRDDPGLVSFQNNLLIGVGATVFLLDNSTLGFDTTKEMARYQSIYGNVKFDNGGTRYSYLVIVVEYYSADGVNKIGQDSFTINPSGGTETFDGTYFRLPLRGQRVKMKVRNAGTVTGTVSMNMYASYRPVERPYYQQQWLDGAGLLAQESYGSNRVLIGSNATPTGTGFFPLGLYSGEAEMTVRNGAGGAGTFEWQCLLDNGQLVVLDSVSVTALGTYTVRRILPAIPTRISLNNGAGVTRQWSFSCYAMSD